MQHSDPGSVCASPQRLQQANVRANGNGINGENGRRTAEPPRVVVQVASPLDEQQLERLHEKLKPRFGEDIELCQSKDSSLIAGIAVRAGDVTVDGTILRHLGALRRRLKRVALPGGKERYTASDVSSALRQAIADYEFELRYDDVGTILSVGDGVARLSGLRRAMLGELVFFPSEVYGMVLNLDEDEVGCVLLGDDEEIKAGQTARLTGRVVEVPVGDALIGRIVDALGRPLDEKGPIPTKKSRPIEAHAPGIAQRAKVSEPLPTGIKVIDALIPLGKGQRELIIGDRQTGKTAIAVDAIINQKGRDVICVYVAIGQKASTISQVIAALNEFGAMDYTVVVAASAGESAPLQYIAPYAGCAIAEEFMESGKDVLIVYDDLSKHAVAYRAMSLLLRRPPGREAYPGDVFYLHSRLLERAAKMHPDLGGGSMTALPIVETLAGDLSAYIPTNLISITDGQIYLESELFFAGVRPAVNVGLSVSRVGGDAQIPAMKRVAGALRLDLAQYREIESFAQFGADLDRSTQAQLRRGERIVEILKQQQYSPIDQAEQVVLLFAVSQRLPDDIPVDQVRWFERELLVYINESRADILRHIRQTGEIDEIADELQEAVMEFKKSLAVSGDQEEK
jgi:F-type H+-transporting ATPase subunit alpha